MAHNIYLSPYAKDLDQSIFTRTNTYNGITTIDLEATNGLQTASLIRKKLTAEKKTASCDITIGKTLTVAGAALGLSLILSGIALFPIGVPALAILAMLIGTFITVYSMGALLSNLENYEQALEVLNVLLQQKSEILEVYETSGKEKNLLAANKRLFQDTADINELTDNQKKLLLARMLVDQDI